MKSKSEPLIHLERPIFKAMFNGILMAYALTIIIFIGYAMLLTYTSVTETYIPLVVILTTILAVFMAAFDTSKHAKEKGWLWGIVAGIVYIAILYIIGSIISKDFSLGKNMFTMLAISIAAGGMGGILGINFKK